MITMCRVVITSLVGGDVGLRGLVEFHTLVNGMILLTATTRGVADLRMGSRVATAFSMRVVRATSKQGMDG